MVITGPGSARRTLRAALSAASRSAFRPDGHGRGALVAYGALCAVDLLATARAPRGPRRAAKPLLMPALALHVLKARPPHPPAAHRLPAATPSAAHRLPASAVLPYRVTAPAGAVPAGAASPLPAALLTGLACAAAGDTALLFDRHRPAFLAGMAAFLGTQLSYTAGMTHGLGALRGIRDRPLPALGCAVVWAAATAALTPTLEPELRLPVAGYGLTLAAMGAAASGAGGRTAAGAVAFIGSDLLIGLQAAGRELPSRKAHEVLIMAGYLLGQYLITTGWLRRTGQG